jgi:hypothetical protein
MRHLLLSLLLLLTLSGCQDKEQQQKEQANHDAQIAQQARTELLDELEKEKQAQEAKNNRFSHMGVKMDQGTITIDTNKTKDFLKELGHRMNVQMKQVSDDLQKGIIDAQEAGVKVNNGNINIDLNKTQTLLDEWSKKIEGYVKEFDEIAKEIEDNRTKETH